MMKKANAFSDESRSIFILVHSKLLINDSEKLQYFFNAAKLNRIEICFTPFNQAETSIEIPEYVQFCKYLINSSDEQIWNTVQFPTGRHVSFGLRDKGISDQDCYDEIERTLKRIDVRDFGFHYAVCSDEWKEQNDCKFSTISFSKCHEVIRLFLIANKDFSITNNFFIDEFTYYIYRKKVMFKCFQGFWSGAVSKGGELEWESALDERLELISLGMDKIRIESLKRQNNSSSMHLQYHMGYLLLLITGTFDNLAWIINNLYQLNLDKRNVDIIKREFIVAVNKRSGRLGKVLTDESIKNRVRAIRELRDRVVHRDFIKTISTIEQDAKTYIWIDKTAIDKLMMGELPSFAVQMEVGNRTCIDCFDFSLYLQECVTLVVDCILEVVSEEIYEITEVSNIEQLFNFPKPYVL